MTAYAEGVDGALIAYGVHPGAPADGAHPPVLLVHGFASDAVVTWDTTGWLRALEATGRAVITVDLRGHGDSDKPTDADAYAPTMQAADLVAVLDSAGAGAVDLVAYSMGCRIASAVAELAPERIRRLVLGGTGPVEVFATWRHEDVDRMLTSRDFSSNPVAEAILGPALAAGADAEVLAAIVDGVAGAPLVAPPDIPVLFVSGELDPVGEGTQALAEDWGARYVSIPGRGHVNALTSRTFKDAVIGFLD
ncbi:MAG: alpha/beta hydrolase [Leifsonia sp.]